MKARNATGSRRQNRQKALSSTTTFERLLQEASAIQRYSLRLYITGTTPRSAQAVSNIRALCEEYLHGRYDLEVVDIYQQPGEAIAKQIIAAPTLVKQRPMPPKRLVGDLSSRDRVIVGLNLGTPAEGKKTTWTKV